MLFGGKTKVREWKLDSLLLRLRFAIRSPIPVGFFLERCYGALTGLNKTELAEQLGEEIVQGWRGGLRNRPPSMSETDQVRTATHAKVNGMESKRNETYEWGKVQSRQWEIQRTHFRGFLFCV